MAFPLISGRYPQPSSTVSTRGFGGLAIAGQNTRNGSELSHNRAASKNGNHSASHITTVRPDRLVLRLHLRAHKARPAAHRYTENKQREVCPCPYFPTEICLRSSGPQL